MFGDGRVLLSVLCLLLPLRGLAFDPGASTEFSLSQGSSYCLGCHDKVPVSPLHQSHPIDVDYLVAQARSYDKLKPPAMLDPAVYLKVELNRFAVALVL